MTRITRLPETIGAAARLACARARTAGIALAPLLSQAGLTRAQMKDRESRITVRSQVDFLHLAAEAMSDDLLGFHLAQEGDPRTIGLLYFVLASSGDLREVMQRGVRYSSLVNEGLVQEYLDGAAPGIRFRYAGISRHRDRHQAEYWLTSLVRIFRQLTAVRLVPTRVCLSHSRSGGIAEMRRYFGCDIEFDAPVDQVRFSPRCLRYPVVNADPYLNKLLVGYCEQAVAHRVEARGPMRARVENVVAPLLPHGRVTAGEVARQLGLAPRTLARHLQAEGTRFSMLVTELRRDLARRYLDEAQFSISKIAWLLGYQGVGPFSHAFKRWTGRSPRAYRERMRRR